LSVSGATIKRIHGDQLQFLALAPKLFDSRVADGRIVDGHGDLRPEHIYLLPAPVVIDCIEFSAEFRRLDVADELSFLTTECDFIGAQAAGRQIESRCLRLLRDDPPPELLDFYRAYRTCVRAKVAVLRAQQADCRDQEGLLAQASRHLALAVRYTEAFGYGLPLRQLFVVHGLTGSGKSTLAAALADELGAEWLSTDSIRRQLFGVSAEPAAYGEGNYQVDRRMAVYNALFAAAEGDLSDGLSVVLDGAFLTAELRLRAADLARHCGVRAFFVHCSCPDGIARQRIAKRARAGGAPSESRPEIFDRQKTNEEPSTAEFFTESWSAGTVRQFEMDTTGPIAEQVAALIQWLRSG
jgi:uncharacterized protein